MPASETKSVLRSIRIKRDLQLILERDAASKGISVNALVNAVLTRYAEWDRYTEKFGVVTLAKTGYAAMFDAIPDEEIDRLGERIGGSNPRDMTLFWFKSLGMDAFARYLHLIARYGHTIEYRDRPAGGGGHGAHPSRRAPPSLTVPGPFLHGRHPLHRRCRAEVPDRTQLGRPAFPGTGRAPISHRMSSGSRPGGPEVERRPGPGPAVSSERRWHRDEGGTPRESGTSGPLRADERPSQPKGFSPAPLGGSS